MANEDLVGWTDLLHSSTKLLEQAAPSAQFPPLQVFFFFSLSLSLSLSSASISLLFRESVTTEHNKRFPRATLCFEIIHCFISVAFLWEIDY